MKLPNRSKVLLAVAALVGVPILGFIVMALYPRAAPRIGVLLVCALVLLVGASALFKSNEWALVWQKLHQNRPVLFNAWTSLLLKIWGAALIVLALYIVALVTGLVAF